MSERMNELMNVRVNDYFTPDFSTPALKELIKNFTWHRFSN